MKIANLTPHEITIFKTNGEKIIVPTSGFVLRVKENLNITGTLNGIKVGYKGFDGFSEDDIERLNKYLEENDIVIVSALVAKHIKMNYLRELNNIARLYFIGNTIRDDSGKVVGADVLCPVTLI